MVNFGQSRFKISKEPQLLEKIRRTITIKNMIIHASLQEVNKLYCIQLKYLKLRTNKLQHDMSTSIKFEESERFSDDKWKHLAIGGMSTFLILGQATQFKFCSNRSYGP